jgi:hypothetical protein
MDFYGEYNKHIRNTNINKNKHFGQIMRTQLKMLFIENLLEISPKLKCFTKRHKWFSQAPIVKLVGPWSDNFKNQLWHHGEQNNCEDFG